MSNTTRAALAASASTRPSSMLCPGCSGTPMAVATARAHGLGIADRCELDQPGAVGQVIHGIEGDLDGQACLAHAPEPDDAHHAGGLEERSEGGPLLGSPDEGGPARTAGCGRPRPGRATPGTARGDPGVAAGTASGGRRSLGAGTTRGRPGWRRGRCPPTAATVDSDRRTCPPCAALQMRATWCTPRSTYPPSTAEASPVCRPIRTLRSPPAGHRWRDRACCPSRHPATACAASSNTTKRASPSVSTWMPPCLEKASPSRP